MGVSPYRSTADGVIVAIRVTPKAATDGFGGIRRDAAGRAELVVKVRAVPEDGKANAAVTALFAHRLGLPRSSVTIATGAKGRNKQVLLRGDARAILDALLSATK